jgi:hypothetical protein
MRTRTTLLLASLLLAATAFGHDNSGFGLTVMVGDTPRPEYFHNGTAYVEAIRGASYALRISNPTPYRVAVALSVDGLNTIDARHTDARDAAKWVLGPYESTVISGWQVSDRTARSFFFTGERSSYGAKLGQTENLGVIEAVYFREYGPLHAEAQPIAPPSPAGAAAEGSNAAPSMKTQRDSLSDDYAATGMGRRERHEVETVDIRLDPDPVASVRIRYEFTPQLVKMGILPQTVSPLERREHARGFSSYCPER